MRRPLQHLAVSAILVAGGCSAPPPPTEFELVDSASTYFELENYVQAVESYDELLEQFPFSDTAELATLRIAQAHYLTRRYDLAIAAFEDFERLYPISPLLPLVEYTVGMCYLDQALTDDRDTSASENALRQFDRLQRRYPDSIFSRLASFRAGIARENIAGHELIVGDYYRQRRQWSAAVGRYDGLIERFPATEAAALAGVRVAEGPLPDPEESAKQTSLAANEAPNDSASE